MEALLSPIPHSRWPWKSSRKPKMMIELNYATDGSRTEKRLKGGVWIGSEISKRDRDFRSILLVLQYPRVG